MPVSTKKVRRKFGFPALAIGQFHSIAPCRWSRNHDALQFPMFKMQTASVVGRVSSGKAERYQTLVCRTTLRFAVVMGAVTPGQEAQTVVEPRQFRTKRIGYTGFEPSERPGTDAAQHGAGAICIIDNLIQAVRAPDGQQVGRIAAADVDHVLAEEKIPEIGDGSVE